MLLIVDGMTFVQIYLKDCSNVVLDTKPGIIKAMKQTYHCSVCNLNIWNADK